jgi:hypothetical protein
VTGLLKAFIQFYHDLDKVQKVAPKTVKFHISENMLPWLDLVLGCVANDTNVADAKMALWQAGLYMDMQTPDGRPGGDEE